MRKVLCLILALAFCVAMACPAFAADAKSPSEVCDHNYKDGKCTICGEKCDHNYVGGKCTICGKTYISSWLGDNPKTGDTIMPYAVTMVVSLSALAAVAVIYRKKQA